MKLKITTDKVMVATILLLLFSIAAVISISIFESKQVDNTSRLVAHTNEVLVHTEMLLSSVKDNESGSRGYVLTGQKTFLDQVERSKKRAEEELNQLRLLTSDNPAQQHMIDSLAGHISSRIEFSDNNILTYDQKGADSAMQIVRTGKGRSLSDQVRRVADSIRNNENILLLQRKEKNEERARNLTGILSSGVVGILLLLGVFVQRIRSEYTEKRKAAAELAKLNEELEDRVLQRTEELSRSKQVLSDTFERITDAFVSFDNNWLFTYVNKKAGEIFNHSPAGLIGKNIWEIFPQAQERPSFRALHQAMETQQYIYLESHHPQQNLWFENHMYPSPEGVSVFIKNITDRKNAEEKIVKANRLYFFISQVNQMIVRTTDRQTLFKEACRIAVELGRFSMAWIGLVNESTQLVEPVIHAGQSEEYLSQIKPISIKEIPEGMGPTGKAIREGKYHICNDIESDPQMIPWKEAALGRGYRSSMSLPIIKFGKVIGAFSFYAPVKDFFDETEIALLEEATGDVSFALEVFEKESMRKNAEQAVMESERRYQTLAEVSPVGIFHTDEHGNTTYVNPRWCQISGMTYDEAMGNGWFNAVHEEDKERLRTGWEEATKKKEVSVSEYRFVRPNGSIAWVIGQAIPERDSEGRIVGYVGTTTDITERKKAEAEIEKSEKRFRNTMDKMLEGVQIYDYNWNCLYVNDAVTRQGPYSKEQIQSLTLMQNYPGIENTELFKIFETCKTDKLSRHIEYEFTFPNGSKSWFELSIQPNPEGLFILSVDISERKKAQEVMKETSEQLRQLTAHLLNVREEERKRIGREIHDELGQQLTAIKMDVSWIDKKTAPENETVKTKLKNVITLLDGGNQSIRRILNELRPVILDDYGLLEALKWQGQQFTKNTGIPITFKTTETQIKVAEEIATCVFRVFQEALTNITRYANAGKVVISLDIDDDHVLLNIEDDGKGFDPELTKAKKSFGILGMKERVVSLNGDFDLVTAPGKGTKLRISLPLNDHKI